MGRDDVEFYHAGEVMRRAYKLSKETAEGFSGLSYVTRRKWLDQAVRDVQAEINAKQGAAA